MNPIRIKRLPHSNGLPLPSYQTSGSAGLDLRAALEEDLVLEPQETSHRDFNGTSFTCRFASKQNHEVMTQRVLL